MKYDLLKNYNRFAILIWVFIFIVFWFQYSGAINTVEAFFLAASVIVFAYPFTTYLSKHLLKKAMERKNMSKFIIQFLFFTLISSALILLIFTFFHQLEIIGLFPVSEFTEWVNIGHDYLSVVFTSLIINLSFCGLGFFEQNIRLQKELTESSLQILKAQINPHFMFNVLNHVNILIRKEPELASDILVQYTSILRYQLYNGKKDSVSITQEVEFLENFIEIEKIRWKNSLDVKLSWEVENGNITIAPLMLITFVENAFKHVSRSKTEKGYVYIKLTQQNKELNLIVENSKFMDDFTSSKEESGIGIENIKKRLDILYPNKHSLLINDTKTAYSIFLTIKL